MLTGLTRYRLGWRKKIVLQVSEWVRTFTPGRAPWLDGYKAVWRDATFQDVMDLEHRKFSAEAPKVELPPPPLLRRKFRDRPLPPEPTMYDVGMEAAFPLRVDDGHDGSEM